jgi:hypothetical protein
MKLAITQIVLGALIAFFSCLIMVCLAANEGSIANPIGPFADLLTFLSGLAVLGVGITQLFKARNKKI